MLSRCDIQQQGESIWNSLISALRKTQKRLPAIIICLTAHFGIKDLLFTVMTMFCGVKRFPEMGHSMFDCCIEGSKSSYPQVFSLNFQTFSFILH
jgi:hypothetical protein